MSGQQWRHGLFGCMQNGPWCLITCFYPYVTSYKIAFKLGMKNLAYASIALILVEGLTFGISRGIGTTMFELEKQNNGEDIASFWEVLYATFAQTIPSVIGLIFLVMGVVLRYRVTSQYELGRYGAVTECLAACCCLPCSLCQMHDQLYPETFDNYSSHQNQVPHYDRTDELQRD